MDAEQIVRAFCAAHHIAMLPDSYRPSDSRAFLIAVLAALIAATHPVDLPALPKRRKAS